jgi:hypothetical protein
MAMKKSLNNPNKPAIKVRQVRLPARNGVSTEIATFKGGKTEARYPGNKGTVPMGPGLKGRAYAEGVSKKGLQKGKGQNGTDVVKMNVNSSSKKLADRTIFKNTKKGTKLANRIAARDARKAQ